MPQCRLFLSKKEWNSESELILKAGRILYDLFKIGPWRVDASRLAELKEPFDYKHAENILHRATLPDRGADSEFIYRNIDDNVFVVWQKEHNVDFSNFRTFVGGTFREKLHKTLDVFASIAPELKDVFRAFPVGQLSFPVAEYANFERHVSKFPKMKREHGLCKNGAAFISISSTWRFYSAEFRPVNFIIYQLNKDISSLPFVGEYLAARNSGASVLPLSSADITARLLNEDRELCGMNSYPNAMLADPRLGHWDLFWPEGKKPQGAWYEEAKFDENYKGRDPAGDIRDAAVCIDFGTTGTVIASRNTAGEVSLLRVGAMGVESREEPKPKHYVNPTVISFDDPKKTLEALRDVPWRPSIRWSDVKSSHQAKGELENRIPASVYHIKTWAKGKVTDEPLALASADNNKKWEFRIPIPPSTSQKDITVDFASAPLNPIELYAYFIGLALNNQADNGGRIFVEYYMTFPAAFDRETRDRILDGFRRGLMRSLPASLIYASNWSIDNFRICERASEPAALAAALLPLLKENGEDGKLIAPTDEGVAFGVFDFGGGTTDIAIGLYRNATENEEETKGWERVIDILDTVGDETLGGEELVRLMIFEAVKANRARLITPDRVIPFERAPGYPHLPGGEELFASGSIARENSYKLGQKLRPVWEERGGDAARLNAELLKTLRKLLEGKGDDQKAPEIEIPAAKPNSAKEAAPDASQPSPNGAVNKLTIEETFKTSAGETSANVKLEVDVPALKAMLKKRVMAGVEKFFTTFGQTMKREGIKPAIFHIVLAGNSSQSPLVIECFAEKIREILKQNPTGDRIVLHPPLLPDPANPEAVTLKTGVAIGLLNSLPGEATGMINRREKDGEAAFPFTIGRLKHGLLSPALKRAAPYGQWVEFGKVLDEGVNKFFYSSSPLAVSGSLPREECREGRLNWGKENAGRKILLKANTPHSAVFALANDKGQPEEGTEQEAKLS